MRLALSLLAASLALATLVTLAPTASAQQGNKIIMCYFGSWSTYRWSYGEFDVENIDPFLCSHLMFGFAGLDPQEHTIKVLDPYNELYDNWGKGAFQRFTALKLINPNLKTILAIGGWNEGSTHYSEMATTFERRKTFIDSCVAMIAEHGFDGLDLDWEYPGGRDDSPGLAEDKVNFALLIREMRAEFDIHGYLLTAAVSAGQRTIDLGYDVQAMVESLDIISLMTYDYHGWFPNHTYTGHNSPMYAMPEEADPNHPGHNFNTDWAVQYWIQQGARREQLLLGMGAYGRGFELQDPAKNGFYETAVNGIQAGKYTGTLGFWGFNEYCEKMYLDGEVDMWTMVRDVNAVAPYIYNGQHWFSYDDITSITIKCQYILDQGLGGGMIWSIDTDDFHGLCGDGPFPITRTVNEVLNGGVQTPPPGWTTPAPQSTTTTQPAISIPPNELCDGSLGHHPFPGDCHRYYECVDNGAGGWTVYYFTCGDNLVFDPASGVCVWPESAPGLCSSSSLA